MKVLLVEDHAGLAMISCYALREIHGHEVQHALTAGAALKVLETDVPDIVLLDLNLPDMHGYEVAQRMRRQPRFDQTIIVALSGIGDSVDPRQAAEAGIDAYYRKPMDFAELETIKRTYRTGVALSPESDRT